METDMANQSKPDRIIWFSMWFLGSMASFGVAFFPLFYYSVDRRNRHFQRQAEFERRVAAFFNKEWLPEAVPERNAKLWAASIILVLPVFAIAYFLTKDLLEHEKHQRVFLANFCPEWNHKLQTISIRNCTVITAATLGFGIIYWLYKVVNVYNNHFKEQKHIEYEIVKLMEAKSHVESV
jgi:hypothetical protein